MNKIAGIHNDELLAYQTLRLQDLIMEIVGCCEDRKLYESQKFALPFSEVKCLILFDGERYLTVKGIAQRLDVAKSRVTKIVNGLIQKDLVERIEDPQDGRVKLIRLTPAGLQMSKTLDAFHREIHQRILEQMDWEERKSMLSYLEKLRSAMEAVKKDFN